MAERPLPKFADPPVNEVIFSVQFDPIIQLTPAHLGADWWDQDRYPTVEMHPTLESAIEQFDKPGTSSIRLDLSGLPEFQANWFLTKDRAELLQVQRDRFTRNWTRAAASTDADYPSFDELLPKFEGDYARFETFLEKKGFGTPRILQCELTYINPILAGEGWDRYGQLGEVLAPWSGDLTEEGWLPEPEDIQVVTRFRILDEAGTPVGRLLVHIQSVYDQRQRRVFLMHVTARGRPLSPGHGGSIAFMNLAHEWIVKGFTSLTTEKMHRIWKRTT